MQPVAIPRLVRPVVRGLMLAVVAVVLSGGMMGDARAQPVADPSVYLPSADTLAAAAGDGYSVAPAPAEATDWQAAAAYEVSFVRPLPPGIRVPQGEVGPAGMWDADISASVFATPQDADSFTADVVARLSAAYEDAHELPVSLDDTGYAARDFRFNFVDPATGERRGVLLRLVREGCAAALVEVRGLPVPPLPSGVERDRAIFLERAAAWVDGTIRAAPPPCAG
jgi:hypothetical protein